jgi:hypothetical protein
LNETVPENYLFLKKIARSFFIPYQKIEYRKATIPAWPWIEEGKGGDAPASLNAFSFVGVRQM